MYAIIAVGGKQLKVHEGDTIRVERLPGEVGEAITFDEVLLVNNNDGSLALGEPTVEGATVTGDIVGHGRAKKITIFKHKRRKNYRRKQGHRQDYTSLKITGIDAGASKTKPTKSSAKTSEPKDSAPDPSVAED